MALGGANPAYHRRSLILGPIAPAKMRGVEIGALCNPLIRKNEGDVLYVDYADTEHLRANQFSNSVQPEDIVEVDIVWGEKPLADCLGKPVDYVVAVHVIEHVPDVIGWLWEIHDALCEEGYLSLAIPDRRYTFDILRPESTAGELIQAYLEKRRIPTPAQKFDFTSLWRHVDTQEAWRGYPDLNALRPVGPENVEVAFAQAKEIHETGRYLDCHCWVFTPESFLKCLVLLDRLDLFPFEVVNFLDSPQDEMEFLIHLRKSGDRANRSASIGAALDDLRRAQAIFADASAMEAEIHSLRAEIDALKASTSWRITQPLRKLRERFA